MATHINEVLLIGTLGKDPEIRQTNSGKSVTNASIATNKKFKTADGVDKDDTQWHNLQIWSKRGEAFGQYNKQGDTVWVRGELRTETWEKDGQTNYRTLVNVNDWGFVHSKGSGGASQSKPEPGPPPSNPAGDDLPF